MSCMTQAILVSGNRSIIYRNVIVIVDRSRVAVWLMLIGVVWNRGAQYVNRDLPIDQSVM